MGTNYSTQTFEQLFGLAKTHSLTMARTHVVTRDSTVFEVQWLEEHNEDNKLVARYRSWTNKSQKPPYRKQVGWERYSLSGKILDREVHYSKRDTNDWLH